MKFFFFGSVSLLAIVGIWILMESRFSHGPNVILAKKINTSSIDLCDREASEKRIFFGKLRDVYGERIKGLWQAQSSSDFPHHRMLQVGPVFLKLEKRNSPDKQKTKGVLEYDSTVWGWEEAHALYVRSQRADLSKEDAIKIWREMDVHIRYLLKNDFWRLINQKKYPPAAETVHSFLPRKAVSRIGKRAFQIKINAGDFAGAESQIEAILSQNWRAKNRGVKILWTRNDPDAYELKANFHSGQSYVSHAEKKLVIANFAWTKTLAHEFGHVLGFDDHYYDVWNPKNCYYAQESRLGDLMSNSELGRVSDRHWQLLDRAYPHGAPAELGSFSYTF